MKKYAAFKTITYYAYSGVFNIKMGHILNKLKFSFLFPKTIFSSTVNTGLYHYGFSSLYIVTSDLYNSYNYSNIYN